MPVLWDKQERTIVNNESSEIIRMLNSEFQGQAAHPGLDLYPEDLREKIDAVRCGEMRLVEGGVPALVDEARRI